MKLNGRWLIIYTIALITIINSAYGIQVTASGGINGESGSVSMNFDALKDTSVSSQIAFNGADIAPLAVMAGPIAKFEQTHAVKDTSGKSASVYVKVLNAPSGLTYASKVLPKEGSVATQTQVSAEQWLTVPKADSIKCTATSSYGIARSASVGLEEARSTVAGDYVTLTKYYGKAATTSSSVFASQTATIGVANSIKMYGTAKDSSGTCRLNTLIKGISGGKATFSRLSETSSAGASTQVVQTEHAHGTFTSTASYTPTTGTAKTKTRTSNYGTEYDINMKAAKGSLPTGILGYYVKSGTTASKIQGAVNAAQSGDTVNVAAGKYLEKVNINKGLTLKGYGNPTATSFALNAILGTGSGGITAPIIYVNPTAKIQDGVTLASSGGTVNIAAGTYKENVIIEKSLVVKGAGSTKTIVDGNKAGSVFTIGKNNAKAVVALSGMTIKNGYTRNGFGGGIYNRCTLRVTSCAISNNKAYGGGGIFNGGEIGKLTVTSSTISGNTVGRDRNGGGNGGGILNKDYGTVTIKGCTISGNTAKVEGYIGYGGGIYSDSGNPTPITVINSMISGNTAKMGGGILNEAGGMTVTGSTISSNTGEGIFSNADSMTLTGSIISRNTGLGIENSAGTAIIKGCTISGNQGGIYHLTGEMTITDSIISGNVGNSRGGIWNFGTLFIGGTTQVINNRILEEGHPGGGIWTSGSITFDGTKVAVKNNKATWPDVISIGTPWYKQYGVYAGSVIPTITGGFNPAKQVTGNNHI